VVARRHFGAHRPIDHLADIGDHVEKAAIRFRHQRGIRGYPIDQAGRREVADLVQVGAVDEELHANRTPRSVAAMIRALLVTHTASGA
jgi:hypothetical protein